MRHISFSGQRLFTIGHGERSVQGLIYQLRQNDIRMLVDVRSAPYSRYQPAFSKEPLARAIRKAGLIYAYLGQELGGIPRDSACYTKTGRVDYSRIKERLNFLAGMTGLLEACKEGLNPCLICAETNPAKCHRSRFLGVAIEELGGEMVHLLKDGSFKSQPEVMLDRKKGQYSLF